MNESSEPPSDRHENPYAAPPTAPAYPNPYQATPPSGGYPPAPPQPQAGYPPPHPYSGYPPPQPYSGYPQPGSGPKNGLGTASLVLAVLALLSCWIPVFGIVGIILGLIALVLGLIGRGRAKRGSATNGGVALAGVLLGGLAVLVGAAVLAVLGIFWKDIGGDDLVSCLQKAGSDTTKQQQCQQQFQQHVDNQFSVTLTPTPVP
jgi:hypothetical protein